MGQNISCLTNRGLCLPIDFNDYIFQLSANDSFQKPCRARKKRKFIEFINEKYPTSRKTTNDGPNYDYVQVLEFLILIAKLLSAMKIFNNIEEIKKLKEEISNQYFEETKHDSNNESAVVKLCLYISKNNTNSENESSSSENQKILKWLKDEPKDLSIEINADENVRIEGKWEILKYCTCSEEENDSEQQVNPNALHLLVSQKLVHKLDQIYVEFYGFTRSNKANDEEGDNSSVESL